jgi:hypothetical protein
MLTEVDTEEAPKQKLVRKKRSKTKAVNEV